MAPTPAPDPLCTEQNIAPHLIELDSNAQQLKRLVNVASRTLQSERRSRAATRTAKKARKAAKALAIQNWERVWTIEPLAVTCEAPTSQCVSSSENTETLIEVLKTELEIQDILFDVTRRVSRKKRKKYRVRAQKLMSRSADVATLIPAETTECEGI